MKSLCFGQGSMRVGVFLCALYTGHAGSINSGQTQHHKETAGASQPIPPDGFSGLPSQLIISDKGQLDYSLDDVLEEQRKLREQIHSSFDTVKSLGVQAIDVKTIPVDDVLLKQVVAEANADEQKEAVAPPLATPPPGIMAPLNTYSGPPPLTPPPMISPPLSSFNSQAASNVNNPASTPDQTGVDMEKIEARQQYQQILDNMRPGSKSSGVQDTSITSADQSVFSRSSTLESNAQREIAEAQSWIKTAKATPQSASRQPAAKMAAAAVDQDPDMESLESESQEEKSSMDEERKFMADAATQSDDWDDDEVLPSKGSSNFLSR